MLTLNGLPAIVEAGSAAPPNMAMHLAKLPALKAPPAGFAANDARYKYSGAWHAAKDTETGELMNFATASSLKLLNNDFFARSKLPRAAQRWNLASLASFLLFTYQRITTKTSAAGNAVYGTALPLLKLQSPSPPSLIHVCGC